MDVYENGIFYGRKLHPSNSMMGDADYANLNLRDKPAAIAPIVDAPTGKSLTAMIGDGKPSMAPSRPEPTGIIGDGKPSMVACNGAKPSGGTAYQEPAAGVPTPAPMPAPGGTPMMGTFQWPQQGGYYEGGQPNNNKTLIMVAIGIAALGGVIYYFKNR
jgi:hypothetical protein